MEDREIVGLFLERSEQSIAEVKVKYGAAIRRVASNILKDEQDVEECVNDTYLQLWNSIPPHLPARLGAFSCRIARNVSLNRYHFNSADKRNSYFDAALDELAGCIPTAQSVEDEYDAKALAGCINRFLETLPCDDRRLFVQRYWFGTAVSGIAEAAGLSAHFVSVRLFRVRKKLIKYLRKEGFIA